MSRDRSTIRDSREAQTLRNAPIPLSRKTGATALRTISPADIDGQVRRGLKHSGLCTAAANS